MNFQEGKIKELRGHKSDVRCVKWSPDGKRLASGSTDNTVRIWTWDRNGNSRDGIELRGHSQSVDQLCWNPIDSEKLATASSDKTVKIWDMKTFSCLMTIPTLEENLNICWSKDGLHVIVSSKDDVLSFINVKERKIERKMNFPFEINEFCFNKDGNYILFTTGVGTVAIYEYPSMKLFHTIQAHNTNCYCIDFDAEGKTFYLGSGDSLASMWSFEDLACIRTFSNLEYPLRAISVSFDGKYLACGAEDGFVDISEVEYGKQVYKIPTNGSVNALSWHPSKMILAYAFEDNERRSEGSIRIFQ